MITIFDPRVLQLPMPFDAKLCNYHLDTDGYHFKIETIAEYLARVDLYNRSMGVIVAMAIPKEGYSAGSFPIDEIETFSTHFDNKWYSFVGGINDENFIEVNFSGAKTFLELSDTPDSYQGSAGKLVSVKTDESGLHFSNFVLPNTNKGFALMYPMIGTGGDEAGEISFAAKIYPLLRESLFIVTMWANDGDGWFIVDSGMYAIMYTIFPDPFPEDPQFTIVKLNENQGVGIISISTYSNELGQWLSITVNNSHIAWYINGSITSGPYSSGSA